MKLRPDLEGVLVKVVSLDKFRAVNTLAEAQGIVFLCPLHYAKNQGPVGTHSFLVWFKDRGVPDDMTPPNRWTVTGGTSLDDLTLAPSIAPENAKATCQWHGFVKHGSAA